jgi:hypothetical protein
MTRALTCGPVSWVRSTLRPVDRGGGHRSPPAAAAGLLRGRLQATRDRLGRAHARGGDHDVVLSLSRCGSSLLSPREQQAGTRTGCHSLTASSLLSKISPLGPPSTASREQPRRSHARTAVTEIRRWHLSACLIRVPSKRQLSKRDVQSFRNELQRVHDLQVGLQPLRIERCPYTVDHSRLSLSANKSSSTLAGPRLVA